MKFNSVLFCIICFYCSVQAQNNGRAVYRIVTQEIQAKESDSKAKQRFVAMLNKTSEVRDSLFFNLDFNADKSLFYLDRKTDVGVSNKWGYNSVIKSLNSNYYKDLSKNELIEQVYTGGNFLITSDLSKFNDWVLLGETKEINNYICYKASCVLKMNSPIRGEYSSKIEAWYCPEIPIPNGPKEYGGLPGLIFELKEEKFTYYIYSIKLSSKDIPINKPKKGRIITREDYDNEMSKVAKSNLKEIIGG